MRFWGTATATAVALMLATAPVSAKTQCIKAGGVGNGVTTDIAKFMAEAATKNQAKAWGGDSVKISNLATKCGDTFPVYQCTASAKACK